MVWLSLDIFWSATNVKTLIPSVVAMILFSLWMRRLLLAKSDRIRNIPFLVIAITILVLEVFKQVLAIREGYSSYYPLPLHFSSLYLYLYPLAHFTSGRFARKMRIVSVGCSAMTAIGILVFPMTVFGNSAEAFFRDFGAFHTITYHYLLVLYFFLFIALDMHKPVTKPDLKAILIGVSLYTAIAAPISNLLKTNFNSFYSCGFPPLEAIRVSLIVTEGFAFGQMVYLIIMYLAMLVDGCIAYGMYRGLIELVGRFFPSHEKKENTVIEPVPSAVLMTQGAPWWDFQRLNGK